MVSDKYTLLEVYLSLTFIQKGVNIMDELIIIIFFILLAFLMVFSFIADRRESISADLMHTFDQTSILIDAIEEAISTNPEE